MLKDKKIVLGITGGIAAYKAVEVASRLRQAGAEVHVIMTKEAREFVTELTFREISGNPVASDMWAPVAHWNVAHIALAKMADLMPWGKEAAKEPTLEDLIGALGGVQIVNR